MNIDDTYVIHIDYEEILRQVHELKGAKEDFKEKVRAIVKALLGVTLRLKPAMHKQLYEQDEKELWKNYQQLQEEKLSILDLSHEWDHFKENIKKLNPELDFQIRDAIDELVEHVTVLAETHRAHIEILEIQSSRRLSLLVLAVSIVILYVSIWEFFANEFIINLSNGLSSVLEYLLAVLLLVPIFVMIFWAWRKRVLT